MSEDGGRIVPDAIRDEIIAWWRAGLKGPLVVGSGRGGGKARAIEEAAALPQYGQMLRRKSDGLMAMYVGRTTASQESMVICMDDNPRSEGWITDRDMIRYWELVLEENE